MENKNIEREMIEFKNELEQLYRNGLSLRQISQYTFTQREFRNIPYFEIADMEKGTKKVLRIWARPIKSQKELYLFFNEEVEGSVLPKYTFYIDLEEGVVLKKRLGKGKENVIYL